MVWNLQINPSNQHSPKSCGVLPANLTSPLSWIEVCCPQTPAAASQAQTEKQGMQQGNYATDPL